MAERADDSVLKKVAELYIGLGIAMCHADGQLKKEEAKALGAALNRLLDSLEASKEVRSGMPDLLAAASKVFSKKGDRGRAEEILRQLLESGKALPTEIQVMILSSLQEIAESDAEYHDLEQALQARVELAWNLREKHDSLLHPEDEADAGEPDAVDTLESAIFLLMAMVHADGKEDEREAKAVAAVIGQFTEALGLDPVECADAVQSIVIMANVAMAKDAEVRHVLTVGHLEVASGFPEPMRKLIHMGMSFIAVADDDVSEEETKLLQQAACELGIGEVDEQAEAENPEAADVLESAIHLFMAMMHADGKGDERRREAVGVVVAEFASRLGLDPADCADTVQAQIHCATVNMATPAIRQAMVPSHLDVVSKCSQPVRQFMHKCMSMIAVAGDGASEEGSNLLEQVARALSIGAMGNVDGATSGSTIDAPTATGGVTCPSAHAIRQLREHLDEADQLIEHWWLADAGRDDQVKPTYAWATGYPVAFLRNEAKGEGGTFLSWEWIEKISYEQLVAAETYDFAGYEGHGFARPGGGVHTIVAMGEHWIRCVDLVGPRTSSKERPGYAAALAHVALGHPLSQVLPGVHAERAKIAQDNFRAPLEYLHEDLKIRRITRDGVLKALILGISTRKEGAIEGVPNGARDAVFAIAATAAVPSELAQLELFASLYARMQRRYVVPFRGQPITPTPVVAHSFETLSQWCALDVAALPEANSGSIPKARMRAIQEDVFSTVDAMRFHADDMQ